MSTSAQPVVVIGGGISGLACAYGLHKAGVRVTLLESDGRPGGLLGSTEREGFLFESGPQSFQGTGALLELIRELGIEGELLRADPRAPRFILRGGHLQQAPMSPQSLLTSSLLSAGSRFKILSEPFRRTKPPAEDESVAAFVRRKFGHEILEYLVSPFVSGVYAGDPETLSLRAAFPSLDQWEREYGSVLRGAMKSRPANPTQKRPALCSFRRGIATLPRAIAAALGADYRSGARVTSLGRGAGAGASDYEARIATEAGRDEVIAARAIVLAVPAYVASHMVNVAWPSLASTLSEIAYAPVAVIATGYDARQTARAIRGFGFLVPRSEKLHTLGTIWNSSLFPGRAPQGRIAFSSFVGGATEPEIAERPDDELAAIVHQENAGILEISGTPVIAGVYKHSRALPQYNLGHARTVEALREQERRIPGIFLSGNYLEGPSIGKCVEQGFATAEAVRQYLQSGASSN